MSRWFRWYEGTAEDGKFRLVARKSGVTVRDVLALWAFILEDAANLGHRGVCERDEDFMASVLDFEDGVAEIILEAMEDAGLISVGIGAITICNFGKRQFDGDTDPTAAERQRRKRERDKGNAVVTRDSRPPDTETETETEVSEPKGSSLRARFPVPIGVLPEQWAAFRQQRKKALNDRSYALLTKKLTKFAEAGWPPGDMIDLAIERGWETVFEPRSQHGQPASNIASLRGARPDPALDLIRAARAAEDREADRGAWPALPAIGTG